VLVLKIDPCEGGRLVTVPRVSMLAKPV